METKMEQPENTKTCEFCGEEYDAGFELADVPSEEGERLAIRWFNDRVGRVFPDNGICGECREPIIELGNNIAYRVKRLQQTLEGTLNFTEFSDWVNRQDSTAVIQDPKKDWCSSCPVAEFLTEKLGKPVGATSSGVWFVDGSFKPGPLVEIGKTPFGRFIIWLDAKMHRGRKLTWADAQHVLLEMRSFTLCSVE